MRNPRRKHYKFITMWSHLTRPSDLQIVMMIGANGTIEVV